MSPKPYTETKEALAVQTARELGADVSEELDAFREAQQERRMIEAEIDSAFFMKGWSHE